MNEERERGRGLVPVDLLLAFHTKQTLGCTHALTLAFRLTRTDARTHAHIHTHTHTHLTENTHTHIHTHTHI